MRKIGLAFVIGGLAGWLVRVAVEPDDTPAPPVESCAPEAGRAVAPIASRASPPAFRERGAPGRRAVPPKAPAAEAPAARSAPAAPADEDVAALLADADPSARSRGISWAARRGLLTVAQLVERSRSDPDDSVRFNAFDEAVSLADEDDGTMDVVAPEVLAWIRDADDDKREFGLRHLSAIGARGAAVGRELLDQGGLDSELYDSAVSVLIKARRFEHLVPEGIDDTSRRNLQTQLRGALDHDAAVAPSVADVLRVSGTPAETDALSEFLDLAIAAHATDIVRGVANSRTEAVTARVRAISLLLDVPAEAAAAVSLADTILTDPASPPSLRRRFLEGIGSDLAELDETGAAVVRRVADHDASPWLRRRAAEILSDAEDH